MPINNQNITSHNWNQQFSFAKIRAQLPHTHQCVIKKTQNNKFTGDIMPASQSFLDNQNFPRGLYHFHMKNKLQKITTHVVSK